MHDPRTLLDPATDAFKKLARRGHRLDLRMLRELTDRRGSAIKDLDGPCRGRPPRPQACGSAPLRTPANNWN